jgi:[ribosomal protein S18]-alanine N-acetyltransferase
MFGRTTLQIRSMTHADVSAVRRVESLCFGGNRGTAADLVEFLDHPTTGALAAVSWGQVVGYLLYQLKPEDGQVKLCHLAVHPDHRRRGLGTRLLERLRRNLAVLTALDFAAAVSERNLDFHLFLRKNGFKAVQVQRGALAGGREDAYLFTARVASPAAAVAR